MRGVVRRGRSMTLAVPLVALKPLLRWLEITRALRWKCAPRFFPEVLKLEELEAHPS